jgi:hypothetical protein
MTMLAKAVRKRERAPPSSLAFCWKTFDILLSQFGTIHSNPSPDSPDKHTPAQSDFDYLYNSTHKYAHNEEMGFRMTPLLEILDIVDRGWPRLMVLSSHPKYHSRAHSHVWEGISSERRSSGGLCTCLPDFIVNNSPNVCMDVMEKVVCRDSRWSIVQSTDDSLDHPEVNRPHL